MRLTPGILALCMMPLVATMDPGGPRAPATETWPTLLSSEPAAVDPDIALLQLRANVALARLIEAGQQAE